MFGSGAETSIGIQAIHPISARPLPTLLARLLEATGILPRVYTSFDLLRRPFWVANDLFQSSKR